MFKTGIALAAMMMAATGYWLLAGRAAPPTASGPTPPAEIMYVCKETHRLIQGPRQPTPAVNPQTGRATLVQVLYCAKCNRWHLEPPPAIRDRMPSGPRCLKHNCPLLEQAPQGVAVR
jgi:hypothetical protein